jgi:hypothetical protein
VFFNTGLASQLINRAVSDGKRRRKVVKRFSEEELAFQTGMPFDDYEHASFYVSPQTSPAICRNKIIRRSKNGKVTIERGTQTSIGKLRQMDAASGYHAGHQPHDGSYQAAYHPMEEEPHVNEFAVSTLNLLRNSPESQPAKQSSGLLVVPRRRRKPAKPTMRTLF